MIFVTELKCSVRSCSFQKDDCCCRGNITVEGAHANRNSETSCGSFEEKKNCGCANSTGKPPKMSDVTCEAVNCKFNEERKCHAKDIQVAGTNACTCMETECASFCCS